MKARYTYLGPLLWLLSIQYYVLQVIVAADWKLLPYSWSRNTISDLANTHCGHYGAQLVCSPLHTTMNASFIVLALTILVGSFLLWRSFPISRLSTFGFSYMALAGFGTLLVGLFPENTVSALHILGAGLSFVFGNIGMIMVGLALPRLSKVIRGYSVLSGVVGLLALVLFMTHAYLGLSIGGMERIVAYPQSIWMTVMGVYFLVRRKKLLAA